MEKYDAVKKSLRDNPSVTIASFTSIEDISRWGASATYKIFPSGGGLYTVNELNSWFNEVLSEIPFTPHSFSRFEEWESLGPLLKMGDATFMDKIGIYKERKVQTHTLDDIKVAARFTNFVENIRIREEEKVEEIFIQTSITGFPDLVIAGSGPHYGNVVNFKDYPHSGRKIPKKRTLWSRLVGASQ